MKKNKIILILFLGVICSYAPKILATKEATFPDINAVQPMSDESTPNISGNIDWPNSSQNQNTSTDSTTPITDQGVTNNNSNTSSTSNTNANIDSNQTGVNNLNTSNSITNNGVKNNSASSGKTSAGNHSSSNYSGNDSSAVPNQRSSGPSNPPSPFNFNTYPTQTNEQAQNAPAPNDDVTNNPVLNQNDTQKPISETNYAWILTFGSMILFVVAFIMWRLKKMPDDVN